MSDATHVIPACDVVAHEANDDCVCGPVQGPVKRTDGSIGWVSTHHSLDGRETKEAMP